MRPPVDPAGVVAGAPPCQSLAPAAVAETFLYLLVNRAVWFVRAQGVVSHRYMGPLVVGQDLGRERACFPTVEIRMTGLRLRAEWGAQGAWQLQQRAFAKQTLRLRSPAHR